MLAQSIRALKLFILFSRILTQYLWLDFWSRYRSPEANAAAEKRAFRRWGALFRRAALDLQGLIIKVGQFLSTRVDMLPDSFTKELGQLQDAVPGAPFAAVRRQIETELGAQLTALFATFDPEPVAAASLGQVHRAVLKDGSTVAVKVLRPGIERLVATDLAALRRALRFLGRHTRLGRRFDLQAVLAEFEAVTGREMDYRQEAEHMRQFRQNFQGFDGIDVPQPYDDLITRRVLVMEFIDGFRITDRAGLVSAGIAPEPLAGRLIDAYLRQALVDGFVHVDPHPGNFIVRPDGRLVFIDFGMMDRITAEDRAHFADLVKGALTRDLTGVVAAVLKLGFVRPGANTSLLRDALGFLIDRISGVPLAEGPEMDAFLEELREWLYEEPLQFPAKYLFLGRAVGLLAGVSTNLDPSIDWGEVLKAKALPLLAGQAAPGSADRTEAGAAGGFDLKKLIADLLGPQAALTAGLIWEQVKTQGLSLLRLPNLVERTLQEIESGKLQVSVDLSPLTLQLQRQERMQSRLAWAILAAGADITGAIL
ncbi:MAG: ABC1 kinase family protein, partial [Mycobacterium leprae]